MDERKILGVTQVNEYIKSMLDGDLLLSAVCVRGEISNYKLYPSGHHYFSIKDEGGALRCVMFRGSAAGLKFRPENGMKVLAFGRVTVFPRDGAYQLYVSALTPDGVGDLHAAFEQLKEKLAKEGLFDPEHKKRIPRYPERIAVITSSAGAAVRDIIRVLKKRYPIAKVMILPVRVQGTEAPPEIAGAIRYADRQRLADVIITGRGGGSIEDLWAFNDERVARAIYECETPVISAVGHEPDVTIADYVADMRAATPSNGAELCVPDMRDIIQNINNLDIRAHRAITGMTDYYRKKLEDIASRRVMRDASIYIDDKRLLLDRLSEQLISSYSAKTAAERNAFTALASKLDALSPLKVLTRGYSIAESGGKVIKSVKDVNKGDKISIKVSDGNISCTAD